MLLSWLKSSEFRSGRLEFLRLDRPIRDISSGTVPVSLQIELPSALKTLGMFWDSPDPTPVTIQTAGSTQPCLIPSIK